MDLEPEGPAVAQEDLAAAAKVRATKKRQRKKRHGGDAGSAAQVAAGADPLDRKPSVLSSASSSSSGSAEGGDAEVSVLEERLGEMKDRLRMYEDPPAVDEMRIVVDGFQWHGHGLNKHCRYVVSRSWKGRRLSVYRRFSDFVALYSHLAEDFPFRLVPVHPDKVLVNTGRDICEDRVEWVQAFLSVILRQAALRESDWVSHFLFDQTEEWQRRLDHWTMGKGDLVAQYKTTMSRFLGLGSKSQPAGSPPAEAEVADSSSDLSDDPPSPRGSPSATMDEVASNGSAASSEPQHSPDTAGSIRSMVSAFSSKLRAAAGAAGAAVREHGSPQRGKRPESRELLALRAQHKALCSVSQPLEACVPSLHSLTSHQNTRRRLERENGRVIAADQAAKLMLDVARHADEQSTRAESLGAAVLEMSQHTVESAEERSLLSRFAETMNELHKSDAQFVAAVKSRHEELGSLQPMLRAALTLKGAQGAVERVVAEEHSATEEKQAPGQEPHRGVPAEAMSALGVELSRAQVEVLRDLGAAPERFAHAGISRAERNLVALRGMLAFLESSDSTGRLSDRAEANRKRLGLMGNRTIWNWDLDTPA